MTASGRGPYDPIELTLSDWRSRGGPGAVQRMAASHPRRFAVLWSVVFVVGTGTALTVAAWRLGWVWAALSILIVLVVGYVGYRGSLESARHFSEAMQEWESERRDARPQRDVERP